MADSRDVEAADHFDDCLFRIDQASDLILESAQPLHDDPKYHWLITRLSFLTKIIDEAVDRVRVMPDGSPR